MNEASPIPLCEDSSTADTPQVEAPARPAMRGDLTKGPILKTLLFFSIPMLLSNVLQTLNGSVNAIWVGRLLGESALAATANANIVMFLVFAAVFGFGMATTVRVGQHFGARDIVAARRTFGTGVGFCILISIATGVIGWFGAGALLDKLGTPAASRADALAYLQVIFVTIPLASVNMIVSMGMRGVGDSKTPLYAMILAVVLDIVFNPLLIIGVGPLPTLGVAGSAIATAIANTAGMVLQIWVIYRKDLPLRLRGPERGYLTPRGEDLRYVLAKGLPMGAQMLIVSSAGLIMVSLVNREGLDAAAAYGASLQLWNYLQMPAFAIGSAVSAMVAQSLGAGDHGRVSKVTLTGMGTNLVMSTAVAALIVGFDRPLLALFLGGQSPALPIAEHIQVVCTASFVIVSITMILTGTMRAYGAVVAPLVLLFLGLYPGRLGFYALARPFIGSEAVWWAYPVGSSLTVILTLAYYSTGRWRRAFKG
ncbi:MATE family efflux transporter [Novosphingobium resinovorum]|uniref:MATE family efflux transporter n=1 Tax=Novosphingobium TaxID=165696 RepID=UPI001B3C8761|nr:MULTISPECIES: MATE family efflux transporter [Novosphingobium]MBF7012129.1 MATE family efflux transporter [Novosphingobium sp. HR1a]WJM26878.1 MATE family efflux transporter [Novosphingobium resinovorum]